MYLFIHKGKGGGGGGGGGREGGWGTTVKRLSHALSHNLPQLQAELYSEKIWSTSNSCLAKQAIGF